MPGPHSHARLRVAAPRTAPLPSRKDTQQHPWRHGALLICARQLAAWAGTGTHLASFPQQRPSRLDVLFGLFLMPCVSCDLVSTRLEMTQCSCLRIHGVAGACQGQAEPPRKVARHWCAKTQCRPARMVHWKTRMLLAFRRSMRRMSSMSALRRSFARSDSLARTRKLATASRSFSFLRLRPDERHLASHDGLHWCGRKVQGRFVVTGVIAAP